MFAHAGLVYYEVFVDLSAPAERFAVRVLYFVDKILMS